MRLPSWDRVTKKFNNKSETIIRSHISIEELRTKPYYKCHIIKSTIYMYVLYIVPSTEPHFFYREGEGHLFEGGAYTKF